MMTQRLKNLSNDLDEVRDGPIPPVSPAVACTMLLSCTFFFIYLLLAISRTYSQSLRAFSQQIQ